MAKHRFFNTEVPVRTDIHYYLPPLQRWDTDEVLRLIDQEVWRDGRPDPLPDGLAQLDCYLSGLALTSGWLVIFDRRTNQPPIAERISAIEQHSPQGRIIQVIRA